MADDVKVAVTEFRRNLSSYVRRAKRGETFEITVRGEPVAGLMPPPSRAKER